MTLINVINVTREPPSFIRDVLRSNEEIVLLHNDEKRRTSDNNSSILCTSDLIRLSDVADREDLIGNPLQIDLTEDHSINESIIVEINNWLKDEELIAGLPIETVRQYINKYLKDNVDKIKTSSPENKWIYGVCQYDKVNNSRNSAIMGVRRFRDSVETCEIFYSLYLPKSHESLEMRNMIAEHWSEVGTKCKVDCEVVTRYNIYGHNLLTNEINSKQKAHSAILMEIVDKNCGSFTFNTNIADVKLQIQTILGNVHCCTYPIWEQLQLVRNYIRILDMNVNSISTTVLCVDSRTSNELDDQLDKLLETGTILRKMSLKQKEAALLDFQNLRESDGIDQLWNLLTSCESIDMVKTYLQFIFTELANNTNININIPTDNKTYIVQILNGIIRGTEAVPTLTPQMALECLIELGITKLKHDYLHILETFNCSHNLEILNVFSLTPTPTTSHTLNHNRLTSRRTVQHDLAGKRRNRTTVHHTAQTINNHHTTATGGGGGGGGSVGGNTAKDIFQLQLATLVQLHTASTALVLLQNESKLQSQGQVYDSVLQSVVEGCCKVAGEEWVEDEVRLSLVEVGVSQLDEDYVNSKELTSKNFRLKSVDDATTVTSIYHHTTLPLFPPSIMSEYDNDEDGEVYVTRYLSIDDKF